MRGVGSEGRKEGGGEEDEEQRGSPVIPNKERIGLFGPQQKQQQHRGKQQQGPYKNNKTV